PRAFLAAVTVITEQTRDRIPAAKKVNLKTVSLFFGARFRVDAPDVLFRIGISSFFHLLHFRLRRQDCKRLNALFSMTPAAANASPAISCRNRSAARARNRDAAPLASDRKSTRLNSSHSQISYAVFCLKKKIILTTCSN